MKKANIISIIAILFSINIALATQPIEIGVVSSNGPVITHSMQDLIQAFQQEWGDGTTVTLVSIVEPMPGVYWLEAEGFLGENSHSMTVKMYKNANDQLFLCRDAAAVLGKCKGYNCSKCRVKYDGSNPEGCHDCDRGPGHCDWITGSGSTYVEGYLTL